MLPPNFALEPYTGRDPEYRVGAGVVAAERVMEPFCVYCVHWVAELRRRLVRHARYFILQLAEGHLTPRLFGQILRRIERLAWHPT